MDTRTRLETTALFLFSAALLSLELSFTKFFSVVLWYHFGFLIISTAMLGFAVSGVYLAFRGGRTDRSFSRLMTLSAVTTIAAYALMTRVASVSEAVFPSRLLSMAKMAEMAAMIVLLFAPFFFLGLTVSRIITARRERAGLYYGANLLGSAVGAILFIVLFDTFRGDIGVPLNALLMLAAAIVAAERWRERIAPAIAALVLLPFLAIPGIFPLDPPRDKILGFIKDVPAALTYTGWSSLSKVDFIRDPDGNIGVASGLWGISNRFRKEGRPWPERQGVIIDSWAYTTMVKYPQDLSFYDYMPTTFVYSFDKKYDTSLHIGAGGGFDLLAARHNDVRSIQGVEINPIIVKAVAEIFGDYSGGIYAGGMPGVEIFVDEGRHFIEQAQRKWDLIQLSGVDTYSSTQAGAFALSENNLYTVEALKSYYGKLNDDGILTMTRWFAPDENGTFRYEVRLLNMAREALRELGVGTEGNLIYFVSENYTVLTIKKGRFTDTEVVLGYDFITKNRFIPLLVPGKKFERAEVFENFLNADPETFEELVAAYPYNVEPPTDDKPFYFEIRRFGTLFTGTNSFISPYNELSGQSILLMILAEVALLGLLLILLPLIVLARRHGVRPPSSGLIYFSLIGAAFMFVEIALSQKLVLYLGHPVYALSVVLFSMLLLSGVGSIVCGRITPVARRRFIALLPVVVLMAILLMPPVLAATLHQSFAVRVLVTLLFAGTLAFFMGMPFPSRIMCSDEREVPVYWGVNGFFSVVASVLTVLISINTGFTAVFIVALVLYALAAVIYVRRFS